VGETVTTGQPLLEIKTGQGMVIVPSPVSGVLLRTMLSVGARAGSGTPLAWVGSPGEEAPLDLPSFVVSSTESIASEPEPTPVGVEEGEPRPFISPVVARMAREYGIDLRQVQGSGQAGRIPRRALEEFVQSRNHARPVRTATAPAPEFQCALPAGYNRFRPCKSTTPANMFSAANHSAGFADAGSGFAPGAGAPVSQPRFVLAQRRASNPAALPVDRLRGGIAEIPAGQRSWMDNGVLLHSEINIGLQTPIEGQGAIYPVREE
jgi:pyruvate/2-oxoglutarate dehydrogenase complex dihydrolipoamide acyltransferase (E2) component